MNNQAARDQPGKSSLRPFLPRVAGKGRVGWHTLEVLRKGVVMPHSSFLRLPAPFPTILPFCKGSRSRAPIAMDHTGTIRHAPPQSLRGVPPDPRIYPEIRPFIRSSAMVTGHAANGRRVSNPVFLGVRLANGSA